MLQARLQIEASTDIEQRGGAHRRAANTAHSMGHTAQDTQGRWERESREQDTWWAKRKDERRLAAKPPCCLLVPAPAQSRPRARMANQHVCGNMCAETRSNQHVCRNCFCISMCAETRASGGAHARRTRGRELPPGQPAAGDALLQTTAGMQMQGAVTSSRCPLCACAHAAWGQVGKHRCGLGRRRGECQGFGGILLRLFLLDGLIGKGEGGAELRVAEAAHLRVDAVLSLPAPPHRTSSANTCVSERGSPCV